MTDLTELDKRLAKVEEWIASEERSRKRKARLDEILEEDPKYSFKKYRETHQAELAEVTAKVKAARDQIDDEEKKGLL